MKIGILGGGSWGSTLAQCLCDNGHDVLIYDIVSEYVDKINNENKHPFFDCLISDKIKATNDITEVCNFTNTFILCVPTKAMRTIFSSLKNNLKQESMFINVSKGIEPKTSLLVSQIIKEELGDLVSSYVVLSGPSHAEELIERKFTALVSASDCETSAIAVQNLFSNKNYLRVYTTSDVIGVEVGGAIKNAIAFVSGIAYGLGMGENARAALITRGILEIIKVVEIYGGKKETAYGLSGFGDLIVTASSFNSRNFQAGLRIGKGEKLDEIIKTSKMVVEGVRTIEAAHYIALDNKIELPIIDMAYDVLFNNVDTIVGLDKILTRNLKSE